jgi:hypothetical protein
MRSTLFAALGGTALVLAAAIPNGSAAPSVPGPGAVLEMHRRLFAALDAGDLERAREHFVEHRQGASWTADGGWTEPRGFQALLLDGEGRAVEAAAPADAVSALAAWSRGAEGARTKVLGAWTDCASAELSYAILELERSEPRADGAEIRRYRLTSLVSHRNGRWVIWHVHLSPA